MTYALPLIQSYMKSLPDFSAGINVFRVCSDLQWNQEEEQKQAEGQTWEEQAVAWGGEVAHGPAASSGCARAPQCSTEAKQEGFAQMLCTDSCHAIGLETIVSLKCSFNFEAYYFLIMFCSAERALKVADKKISLEGAISP